MIWSLVRLKSYVNFKEKLDTLKATLHNTSAIFENFCS